MKYIDADILKAEIERYENTAIDAYNPLGEDADFWHGKVVACEDLKAFVTSLQQKQPEDIPSAGSGAMSTTPPKFKLEVKEQPVDGMEEDLKQEYDSYCHKHLIGEYLPSRRKMLDFARHFAEWGMNQCPLPEDTTIFMKGVAEGKRLMMKEAVECMVTTNLANRPIIYLDQLQGFQYGEKVKLIIVKENEK